VKEKRERRVEWSVGREALSVGGGMEFRGGEGGEVEEKGEGDTCVCMYHNLSPLE